MPITINSSGGERLARQTDQVSCSCRVGSSQFMRRSAVIEVQDARTEAPIIAVVRGDNHCHADLIEALNMPMISSA